VDIINSERLQNRSKACAQRLMRDNGYRGYSLMSCPEPAYKAAYPHMSYACDSGSSFAPYDVIHLVLKNIVSTL